VRGCAPPSMGCSTVGARGERMEHDGGRSPGAQRGKRADGEFFLITEVGQQSVLCFKQLRIA
jgi:hypothetical protein